MWILRIGVAGEFIGHGVFVIEDATWEAGLEQNLRRLLACHDRLSPLYEGVQLGVTDEHGKHLPWRQAFPGQGGEAATPCPIA